MAAFVPKSCALITGGASGIGLAIAKLCAGKEMRVILVDRDIEALKRAESEVRSAGKGAHHVSSYPLDVSRQADWDALKNHVESQGSVELLVLNAGTMPRGTWGDANYFRNIMETNLFGVINGINTLLPTVREASKAKPCSIVITGSKQGITNPPGNPAYNASKSAVKTLAEHLSYDLKDTLISVHLLVPGWTFTGMTGGGQVLEKPAGAWAPEQVAEYLHQKMVEKKFYVICPDNDVSEETDKKRMLWSVGDIIKSRLPLSRWRPEYKQEAEETMAKTQV
ncbi:Ketoacyl reductase HetN [Escovopsis weberi]|uniref:Ketoacyl reductase HetN n=1 Tax=Escovopsis weberi TaxID=150374 RepID=A0A0M8N6Z4_ESCWE|nr:Ketoacyl reductase HetN [Escovopsis weberi]